jgi:hypothetical protein
MGSLMAGETNGFQIPKEFTPHVFIAHVMNLNGRAIAAALADTVRSLQDLGSKRPPGRRLEISVILLHPFVTFRRLDLLLKFFVTSGPRGMVLLAKFIVEGNGILHLSRRERVLVRGPDRVPTSKTLHAIMNGTVGRGENRQTVLGVIAGKLLLSLLPR